MSMEVILNGDFPAPTRVIEGVVQPVAPTTVEQRLARKNKLKARGTLLMALPYKHQLKFNIHKDAKTLMEAIEKRFGGNKDTKKVHKTLFKQQYDNFTGSSSESLAQIHDRLQKLISQLEILGESLPQEDINLKFLRSLPTEWRTHTLIWRNKTDLEEQNLDDLFNSLKIYEDEVKSSSFASTSTQNIAFVSSQNTDSTNEPISAVASVSVSSVKIHVSALPNVDTLSNAMVMLTVRARRFLLRTGRNLGANGPTSMGFDMSKVECYNCHRKGHFARECSVMVWTAMTGAFRQKKNQPTMPSWHLPPQVLSVLKMRLESVEARLLVYQQNETVFEEDIKLPKLEVQLIDNALVVLRQKFEKAEQERNDLKLKLEKFQTFSKNLSQLLASQTNDKTGLGYNNQVFTNFMFDCDKMFSSKTDESLPASLIYDSPTKPDQDLSHTHRPSAPIIEDWVSDSEDDSDAEISQNVPGFVQPFEQVKTPRPSAKPVENSIPTANPKTDIIKPQANGNSMNRKACFVCKSLTYLIKDCDYYEMQMVQTNARHHAKRGNTQHYARMSLPNPQRHVMRIEQYFLMTDYSLWEVILNGDSPASTRVIEGVVQPVAPTTAEQRGNNFNQNRGGNFNQSNFNQSSFNQGQLNRPQPRLKYAESVPEHPKSVQNLQNQMATLTDMMTKLVSANTALSSGSGTLPDLELKALDDNGTWELTTLLVGKKAIDSHWLSKTKLKADSTEERKKARLVIQGNIQRHGVDYQETFAPIAKLVTVKSLLAVTALKGWDTCQMDVSNAFLHGDLLEEVYMRPPFGYTSKGKKVTTSTSLDSNLVCKLKKSLYGLKQAPRQWFFKLSSALVEFGYTQYKTDYSLFVKKEGSSFIAVLLADVFTKVVSFDQHTKLLSKLEVSEATNSQLEGECIKEKGMNLKKEVSSDVTTVDVLNSESFELTKGGSESVDHGKGLVVNMEVGGMLVSGCYIPGQLNIEVPSIDFVQELVPEPLDADKDTRFAFVDTWEWKWLIVHYVNSGGGSFETEELITSIINRGRIIDLITIHTSFMVIISSLVSKLVEGRNHTVKPATLVFAAATEGISMAGSSNQKQFKRLTKAELADKRSNGLCFMRGQKFTPGHTLVDKENKDDGVTDMAKVSLNSRKRFAKNSTIRLRGRLGGEEIWALIDSRSTDNLISANLVERLGIKVTDTVPFRTTLGNGETVYNQGICKGVIISFPELQVVEDFNMFNMGNERHYNVILGIKWLKTLGDVMVNLKLLTMTFGSDTGTPPPHYHCDTTTATLPPQNPNNTAPYPTTTSASPESPPLNVTSIERPTTTYYGHQDKRLPKGHRRICRRPGDPLPLHRKHRCRAQKATATAAEHLVLLDRWRIVAAPEICCRRQKHRCGAQKAATTAAEHLVLLEFELALYILLAKGAFNKAKLPAHCGSMRRNTHSDSSKAHGKKLARDTNYQIASSSEVGRLSLEDEVKGRVAAKSILIELADRVVDSHNGLKESGCDRPQYGFARSGYYIQEQDQNAAATGIGNVYLTDSSQGEVNGHFRPVRVHVRGTIDGLAGIGCRSKYVPRTGWPPTGFVFSRVPLHMGNRNCQQVEFQEDHRLNDGQVKHSPEYFYAGSLWKVSVEAFNDEDLQFTVTLQVQAPYDDLHSDSPPTRQAILALPPPPHQHYPPQPPTGLELQVQAPYEDDAHSRSPEPQHDSGDGHGSATFPRRQVAGERYPQQQVAGESPRMSLGKAVNVVVRAENLVELPECTMMRAENLVVLSPLNDWAFGA
uniref:Retrovirus-related Pol polyprotein from transposon TNT 1-94 n=1 Tax=Tanacetum cinerariifolium TaxID=118510 RepID=A0A6L2MF39_TANCI|nr:retrovirus-related Pol polyprotein from transposon TNT 1-94 [Tanacetum cinerariifolium]